MQDRVAHENIAMNKIPLLNERWHLGSPDINVCFRIIIEGKFSTDDFEKAIDAVCKRHPALNYTIETDAENNTWFVPDTGRVGLEFYNSKEMPDWQDWYKKTDDVPFNFRQGPLVKICVIFDNNQTEIIVLGHHVIGDGIAYLNLSRDILSALDNKIDTVPQILPVKTKLKKKTGLSFLARLYARKLNKEWRKNPAIFSESDYHTFFEQYRKKYVPQMYMESIKETDLNNIIQKCKSYGLTVNELITAAFAVAMVELSGHYPNKEIRLGAAANIRGELIEETYHCMGNYVSGITANVNYTSEKAFMTNAQDTAVLLRAQLKVPKNRYLAVNFFNKIDKDLLEAAMYATYGDYQIPAAKKLGAIIGERSENKGMGMSNLGKYEFDKFANLKVLDLQFIGPAFPANLLSVGLITVNNKLNINLRYNETEIKTDIIKKVYERAVELLLTAQ
ncbi:hypothetical protein FACS189450_02930 [Spirochaetia bacterium]|nr:hypothetical protein FACS189450_02930 [Spirochaetia bacterium]